MDAAASAHTCFREIVDTPVILVMEKSSCTSFVDSGAVLVQVVVVGGGGS